MTALRVERLNKAYSLPDGSRRLAIADISFTVAKGEFCSILGPSGCGKTTLLNVLSGVDQDYGGSVSFGAGSGHPIIGYVFQDVRLLPWLTAWDNVAFVIDRQRLPDWRRRVDYWLQRVGLSEHRHLYPGQLSIGMQQRLAVARALVIEPELLLMDEPFSSLDEITALRLRDELLHLWDGSGLTVLFVTHNPVEAVYLSDRVLVLTAGPARIQGELDVRRVLPRPRKPNDPQVWRLAREAVTLLEQGASPRGSHPALTREGGGRP